MYLPTWVCWRLKKGQCPVNLLLVLLGDRKGILPQKSLPNHPSWNHILSLYYSSTSNGFNCPVWLYKKSQVASSWAWLQHFTSSVTTSEYDRRRDVLRTVNKTSSVFHLERWPLNLHVCVCKLKYLFISTLLPLNFDLMFASSLLILFTSPSLLLPANNNNNHKIFKTWINTSSELVACSSQISVIQCQFVNIHYLL